MGIRLDDYDWGNQRETARVWVPDPPQTTGDERDPFERDRARIIHSVAFRRLQGKTQIFASSADFLRTRVTHSIEVAQIGRALASRFGVNDSLVEAACLGHDLGHPPFGHTGEEVLAEIMSEIAEGISVGDVPNEGHEGDPDPGSFEGNAQSFRAVTRLEQKSADYPGLDLCRATLLGLLKYPYRRSADHSKFLYDDDLNDSGDWLFADAAGLPLESYDPRSEPPRTLPCQLMDWADDIAYSVHDLEDGIASEMLDPRRWASDSFIETICAATAGAPIRWRDVQAPSAEVVAPIVEELIKRLTDPLGNAELVPLDVIRDVTRHYIDKFATAPSLKALRDGGSLFDFSLDVPEEIRVENQVLKTITFEFVVNDAETRRLSFKGREILKRLFDALFQNLLPSNRSDRLLLFPRAMRDGLDTLSATQAAREVCDYLAGMTEGQALRLYAQLFEPSATAEFGRV